MPERQLHLFKSKRQRGVAPPPPLEFEVHCMLADTLRRWATPTWLWAHYPAGENRDAATGARLKRMGVMPGFPDLMLFPPKGHPSPHPHFLELKRRGGKIKGGSLQDAFRLWCLLNEYPHAVADNYAAAVAILQQWGALRTGVRVQ